MRKQIPTREAHDRPMIYGYYTTGAKGCCVGEVTGGAWPVPFLTDGSVGLLTDLIGKWIEHRDTSSFLDNLNTMTRRELPTTHFSQLHCCHMGKYSVTARCMTGELIFPAGGLLFNLGGNYVY